MGTSRMVVAAGVAALGLGAAAPAFADPLPGLQNQNFTEYNGNAPKGSFTSVNPVGWTGGGGLIYIASPYSGSGPDNSASGPIPLQTYGSPTGNIPGNYVEADGNPDYEGSFNYEVTGLVAGTTYDLSFYQGASQQTGFATNLPTTNQWIVSLADSGLQLCHNCGPVDPIYGQTSSYFSSDPNASIAASPLMTVAPGGTVGWEYVHVQLKAYTDTELLSFLAWGDNGSTVNLPPIAFLSGVDSPAGLVPEPSTWALMGLGFVGVAGLAWRRTKRPARAIEA